MLSGKRFRLKVETVGIESLTGNRRVAVKLPAGSVVKVETGPTDYDGNMVEVRWAGRQLAMFLKDLQARSEPVNGSPDGKDHESTNRLDP
jgi:hypothetical protein